MGFTTNTPPSACGGSAQEESKRSVSVAGMAPSTLPGAACGQRVKMGKWAGKGRAKAPHLGPLLSVPSRGLENACSFPRPLPCPLQFPFLETSSFTALKPLPHSQGRSHP